MKTTGAASGQALIAYAEMTSMESAKEDGKAARTRRHNATERARAATHAKIDALDEQADAQLDGAKKSNRTMGIAAVIGGCVLVAALVVASVFTFGAALPAAIAAAGFTAAGFAALTVTAGAGIAGMITGLGAIAAQSSKNKMQAIADSFAELANEAELEQKTEEEEAADAKDLVTAALDRKQRLLQAMEKRDDRRPRSWLTNA
jgi:uncharacterized membrane protein YcjF (UPF0283 family)